MSQKYYMLNLQKLLFMIEELHKRGYESLKAIPSLSPSGMGWHLELFNADWSQRESASKWLECNFKIKKRNNIFYYRISRSFRKRIFWFFTIM